MKDINEEIIAVANDGSFKILEKIIKDLEKNELSYLTYGRYNKSAKLIDVMSIKDAEFIGQPFSFSKLAILCSKNNIDLYFYDGNQEENTYTYVFKKTVLDKSRKR